MKTARIIHEMVNTYFSDYCNTIDGLTASRPEGGFYFTVDFNTLKNILGKKGIHTAEDLTQPLLTKTILQSTCHRRNHCNR